MEADTPSLRHPQRLGNHVVALFGTARTLPLVCPGNLDQVTRRFAFFRQYKALLLRVTTGLLS